MIQEEQITKIIKEIEQLPNEQFCGYVIALKGMLIECSGLEKFVSIGSICHIKSRDNNFILAEVIGFNGDRVLLMPFTDLEGVGVGCDVLFKNESNVVFPDKSWLGRIVNARGEEIDNKGKLLKGETAYKIRNNPPLASERQRVKDKIDLGVKAINTFLSCCKGQRMGVFSGSGVGKSVLLSMLTKFSKADVKVIGLIGERGREVQEFLEDYLGEEGLKNAVVVVATGDESALMRRRAAYLTMTISEYFRDQGKDVLCLMDSVTRFAMAQREIGLSGGEPPTTKGYTPTVFSEMPKLLERAGPGKGKGTITGIFTVLVEGDDHNEPVSDAVRGILDGHIVLERQIAQRGRFPAINILKSISRTMPGCNSEEENNLINKARAILATYENMAELIRLGAYKKGSDQKVDESIKYYELLESFLAQKPTESFSLEECYKKLSAILNGEQKDEQ